MSTGTRAALAAAAAVLWLACAPTAASARTVYVANNSGGASGVTPIDTATNTAGSAIAVGANPRSIAIAPDGATAYVVNQGVNNVSPIDTQMDTAGTAISVGNQPLGIAITPNGTTAYVSNFSSNNVTPINLADNTARPPIAFPGGAGLNGVAITPDGATAYVTDQTNHTVTPIETATNTAGAPIGTGGLTPNSIAITSDGETAYVTNNNSDTVTPIDTATNTAGTPIPVGDSPVAIAIAPDGDTAYVANFSSGNVTPIDTSNNAAGTPIDVGDGAAGIAITPDGTRAYVANNNDDNVTPVNLQTNNAGTAIGVVDGPRGVSIVPDQGPTAAFDETPAAAGSPTSFDGTSSSDPDGTVARYDWDFGDGTVLADGGPSPSHTYAAPGNYTVTLTVTDNEGCSRNFVFTGQTASCNGGPAARSQRSVSISAAPDPPPPTPDTTKVELSAQIDPTQEISRTVTIDVSCDEPCVVVAKGKLKTVVKRGGEVRRDTYVVRKDGVKLETVDERGFLELVLTKKAKSKAQKAIKRGGTATVKGKITATDDSENVTVERFEIELG